jgi:hypothetical protein
VRTPTHELSQLGGLPGTVVPWLIPPALLAVELFRSPAGPREMRLLLMGLGLNGLLLGVALYRSRRTRPGRSDPARAICLASLWVAMLVLSLEYVAMIEVPTGSSLRTWLPLLPFPLWWLVACYVPLLTDSPIVDQPWAREQDRTQLPPYYAGREAEPLWVSPGPAILNGSGIAYRPNLRHPWGWTMAFVLALLLGNILLQLFLF